MYLGCCCIYREFTQRCSVAHNSILRVANWSAWFCKSRTTSSEQKLQLSSRVWKRSRISATLRCPQHHSSSYFMLLSLIYNILNWLESSSIVLFFFSLSKPYSILVDVAGSHNNNIMKDPDSFKTGHQELYSFWDLYRSSKSRYEISFSTQSQLTIVVVEEIYFVIKLKVSVITAEYGDRYTLIDSLNRASISLELLFVIDMANYL